jgi:hypothetical protein
MGAVVYHNPLTGHFSVDLTAEDYGGQMKRTTLSLLSLVIFGLMTCSAAYGQPKVQLSETGFNFGKAAQHAQLTHTFWIKSVGTDTLDITKVEPGCSCTQAPLSDSIIAPGDSVALEIQFSTRSYRGFVAKRPYIETNASADKLYLRIDCELVPDEITMSPIKIEPVRVDVSQFTKLPRRKAKFLLTNTSDKDYDLKVIDDKDKDFDVSLPKKIKAGETADGFVEVHEDAIEKNFEESVTFQISDEQGTRFSIPVKRMYRVKSEASK